MRRACAVGLFLTVFAVASWGSGSSERDLPDGRTPPQEALPREYQDQAPPGGAGNEFETDFSRATISYAEILSGGPRKDGIPAIDAPRFVSVAEAGEWVSGNEPVLVLEERIAAGESDRRVGDGGNRTGGGGDDRDGAAGAVHIYPLQILTWHEIVNDVVGEIPVAVTYCPLCNTGIAFDRRHAGEVLDFGTTGRLRFSNLLMYDRQTESWWQQASGAGVIGRFAGTRLRMVPVRISGPTRGCSPGRRASPGRTAPTPTSGTTRVSDPFSFGARRSTARTIPSTGWSRSPSPASPGTPGDAPGDSRGGGTILLRDLGGRHRERPRCRRHCRVRRRGKRQRLLPGVAGRYADLAGSSGWSGAGRRDWKHLECRGACR